MFVKYPSITNHTDKDALKKSKDKFSDVEFVATEKIHGAKHDRRAG